MCINTIRMLAADAVEAARSGHPGMPMGAAPMACVLWTRFLRHNPANPTCPDRDRFVLSAGHGSILLYSLLHLTGYDLPIEQDKGPVALCLCRQAVPTIDRQTFPSADGLRRSAYVIADADSGAKPDVIIMASATDVHITLEAAQKIEA